MSRRHHPIHYVMRLILGLSPQASGQASARSPNLEAAIGESTKAEKAETADVLWRGAMVQMKAVNTATAWPIRARRKMRSEAEARLNRYFAQVERTIAGMPGEEAAARYPESGA